MDIQAQSQSRTVATLFTEHPASVGETYGEHFVAASGFGLHMIATGLACMVHAVLPFLFVRVGTNAVSALYDRIVVNRRRAGR